MATLLAHFHHTLGAPLFASFHIAYPNRADCIRKGWVTKLQSSFYPMGFAVNQRPAFDRTPVAGLPVGVFGFQDEPGIDYKMQRGLVLKADVNRMVLAGGEDLYKIDDLAFDLFKAVERASTVSADSGLAALGFGKAQRSRNPLSLAVFAG